MPVMFFPAQVQPNGRVFLRSDGSLHIEKTVPEDAGKYVCTAVNVAGSMNITVSLEVHGKKACWRIASTFRKPIHNSLRFHTKMHYNASQMP